MTIFRPLALTTLLAGILFTSSIYNITFTSIEGPPVSLSAYSGRRMLVITLPVVQNSSNDSLLRSLDSLAGVYPTLLTIVAAPSYEDGFTPSQKEQLRQWYRTVLRPSILITDGMHTRKISGMQQDALFKWLTDKNENGVMDKDVEGPGHTFFIRTNGSLQAVFSHRVKLSSSGVNRIFQAN